MMFDTSLPPAVCRRAHVLFMFLCLFPNSGVQHFVLWYFFTFVVPYSDHLSSLIFGQKRCLIRLYFLIFVEVFVSYLCCLFSFSVVKHVLIIWVAWQVSYQRQELLSINKTPHTQYRKLKTNNTDANKNWGWTRMPPKRKQFLPLIRYLPCYSYN
jgi:hypothetical protein